MYRVCRRQCMLKRSRCGPLLALLMAATLLSSGFVGAGLASNLSTIDAQQTTASTTNVDGEAVVENFTERIETLETVEFTRTAKTETNNRTINSTIHVVADLRSGQKRTETIDSAYGANTTTVVNETHRVTYNPEKNTVNSYEYKSQDNSVLPQLAQMANESAVAYEYAGTSTVNGEDVYLLNATPQQTPEDRNVSVTVAVDTETYFLVQYETSLQSDRSNFTVTRTYSNVTINGDIPESAFELDVPEDATEPSLGPEISSYDKYSTLQSAANLSVPADELPDDFKFDSASIIDGEAYYSVSLTYTNGNETAHVSIQEESRVDWSDYDNYNSVEIGNETGYYNSYDEYKFLHVNTDEQSYSVSGELNKSEIIDIGTELVNS